MEKKKKVKEFLVAGSKLTKAIADISKSIKPNIKKMASVKIRFSHTADILGNWIKSGISL